MESQNMNETMMNENNLRDLYKTKETEEYYISEAQERLRNLDTSNLCKGETYNKIIPLFARLIYKSDKAKDIYDEKEAVTEFKTKAIELLGDREIVNQIFGDDEILTNEKHDEMVEVLKEHGGFERELRRLNPSFDKKYPMFIDTVHIRTRGNHKYMRPTASSRIALNVDAIKRDDNPNWLGSKGIDAWPIFYKGVKRNHREHWISDYVILEVKQSFEDALNDASPFRSKNGMDYKIIYQTRINPNEKINISEGVWIAKDIITYGILICDLAEYNEALTLFATEDDEDDEHDETM